MKKLILKSMVLFCVSALLINFADMTLPNGEDKIYGSVVRLHILANSDSEYDQQLKLKVRDAVIASGTDDKDELLSIANGVLADEDAPYAATCAFGYEDYDTREYDGISFPAGRYLSYRIMLGTGEGKNWWCVLFPPLCLSAATAKDSLEEAGIDERAYEVYTDKKYVIRFKLLELFKRR